MLQLINGADNPIINTDDFYIDEKWSGLDELVFQISVDDPSYQSIYEEAVIDYEQPYLVKAIDGSMKTAKVKCQLDVDALKADILLNYNNGSDTVYNTVVSVLPTGWTLIDEAGHTFRRTIKGAAYTPFEVIDACRDAYNVAFRFDIKKKIIRIVSPDSFEPLGAFVSSELNLKELNYKGKSAGFATRLYARGKDGMTFADINDGKDYVDDNTYSNKIVCAYWEDNRYTDKESLLADAKKTLKSLAVPARSYNCAVYDLAKTNPEKYKHQDFSLFSIVKLIDEKKNTNVPHQVVNYRRYPHQPERNEVTLSTLPPSITYTVKNLQTQLEKPTSNFRQQMQNLIDSIAVNITDYDGGNLVITENAEGKPNGIMIMDTDDKTTAQKVMWLNLMGITYSQNGIDGPFESVWSFEENGFVADWIAAGVLQGIKIIAESGTIGGWDIEGRAIKKDVVDPNDPTIVNRVYFQPPLASGEKTWVLSCQKSTNSGASFGGKFILYSDGSAEFGDIKISPAGKVYAGNATNGVVVMQKPMYPQTSDSTNWVFAAGGTSHNSYADCPFRVNNKGELYADKATIEGKIKASSGSIAGWEITEDRLSSSDPQFISELRADGSAYFNNTVTIGPHGCLIVEQYIDTDDVRTNTINATGKVTTDGRFHSKSGVNVFEGGATFGGTSAYTGYMLSVLGKAGIQSDLLVQGTATIADIKNSHIVGEDSATAVHIDTYYALYVMDYSGQYPQEVIASTFTTQCSEKWKDNIEEADDVRDIIKASKIYKYNRKSDKENPKTEYGLILERECPEELMNSTKDGVDTFTMMAMLWHDHQRLIRENEDMAKRVASLEKALGIGQEGE